MKRLFLSFAISVLLVVPQLTLGSDLDELKAADERSRALDLSLQPGDVEAYVAIFSDEFLYIDSAEGFPSKYTKDQLRQAKKATIAALESQSYSVKGILYAIAGNTGVVSHYGTFQQKPKGGPAIIRNMRWMITLTKSGGKWLVVAANSSTMPAGD
jgi:hypothetical protein